MISTLYILAARHAHAEALLNEEKNAAWEKQLPVTQALRDFRTFAIRGSRGSGHTTAALALADSLPDTLLLTLHPSFLRFRAPKFPFIVHVNDVNDLGSYTLRGHTFKTVIVDEASDISARAMDDIYVGMASRGATFFILLG